MKLPSSGAIEGGFFNFYLNPNLAFSLPLPNWLILTLTFIILVILLVWLKKLIVKKSILIWPVSLIILGAVSNLMDRLNYGGVVDFIDLPYFSVFNLSDVYISIGVIWLLIWEFNKKRLDNIS